MLPSIPLKYFLSLIGLAVSAFIFNTSEFMPIGLLMDISESFGMTTADTGIMISIYAWMVALLSLPLMLLTCRMNLRKLMLITIAVFSIGQLGSGIATSFPMLMAARICVACAHSIFWSIAAPLATRLVTRVNRPFALSMIVTGSSIAMIFGLPLGRVIGLYAGWRMTFLIIAAISLAVMIYLWFLFPKMGQPEPFSAKELPAMLRQPGVLSIYIITLLFATSYFTVYSYIEPFLAEIAGFSPELISMALTLLGCSGLLGSFIFSRFYGTHRKGLIRFSLLGITAALLLWHTASAWWVTMIGICMAAGTFATIYNVTFQGEIIHCVSPAAVTVAMSIFSGIYNLGIGSGTWIGGYFDASGSLFGLGYIGGAIAAASAAWCIFVYLRRPLPDMLNK